MYVARQNKEKVSRRIDADNVNHKIKIKNGIIDMRYVYQRFTIPKRYGEHVKGEIKNGKLSGGHSQPLMALKWNNIKNGNLTLSGTQSANNVYEATWTILYSSKNRKFTGSSKKSTFFPDGWDFNRIKAEIESVTLQGGANFGESTSGIKIAKSGDTAYPVL